MARRPASEMGALPEDLDALLGPPSEERDGPGALPEDIEALLAGAATAPRGRQPTLSERLAIKTFEAQAPGKVEAYMERRGIDPDFDRGFSWHDPTIDIAGDVARAVGAGAGGVLGLTAGVPGGPAGSLAGAGAGAAAGSAATGAGLKGLAHLLSPEVAPTAGSVAKEAAVEGALTPLLGAGAQSGLISRALHGVGPGRWLRNLVRNIAGVDEQALQTLNRMTGRQGRKGTLKLLKDQKALETAVDGRIKPFHGLTDDPLYDTALAGRGARKEAAKSLEREIKKAPPLTLRDVGLTPEWLEGMKKRFGGSGPYRQMVQALEDGIPGGFKRAQKSMAGKATVNRKTLRELYTYLGENRDNLGPPADALRNSIANRFSMMRPRIKGPWQDVARKEQAWKTLLRENQGEDPILFQNLWEAPAGRNITPALRKKTYDELAKDPRKGSLLLDHLQGMAGGRADYEKLGRTVRGLELGRKEVVPMADVPYLTKPAFFLGRVVNKAATPILNWYNQVERGPWVSKIGGLHDWARRGGEVSARRQALGQAPATLQKELAKALAPPSKDE